MPRSSSNSARSAVLNGTSSRNGQWKLQWSFSYEFEWPAATPHASRPNGSTRSSSSNDDLGLLLEKALAYAG